MACAQVYPVSPVTGPGSARSVWELSPEPEGVGQLLPASPMSAPTGSPRRERLVELARAGELDAVEALVEERGPGALGARDEWGYTAAHWAALDGDAALMRFIIERRGPVDLACLGTQGPRPIHWACRKGHSAVVALLLEQAGVGVDAADLKGLTPLMTACMFGRLATAAFLLGRGASPRLTDVNGDTAAHWAAYKGHAELVRLLLHGGVELHRPDYFGSTPLHLACLAGHLGVVRILCEQGRWVADLEPRDKNGKTPLQLARSHRHHQIVRLLQRELSRREGWLPPLTRFWGMLFGGAGHSKSPLFLLFGSFLLWGYPMYLFKCVPITWNLLRGSHYLFIYWNALMWFSWLVANRKDPGYLPRNSDAYYRAIKQVRLLLLVRVHVNTSDFWFCPCRFLTLTSGRNATSS